MASLEDLLINLRKNSEWSGECEIKYVSVCAYDEYLRRWNNKVQYCILLQACESSLKHKTEMVGKLEEKTNQLVSTLREMEKR